MFTDNDLLDSLHLGIVCPMANEQDTAEEFTRETLIYCNSFKKLSFFVIFDNSCTDKTFQIERRLAKEDERIKVIWAPDSKSVVDAYIRGYKEALKSDCDWILEIDAGYSHQPSDLENFFNKFGSGDYDCIFGSRFCDGGSITDASVKRYILSKGGTILTNLLLGTNLTDMTSGFQLFKRETLQKIMDKGIKSRGHFFQTEMKAYCRNIKLVEVPIHYKAPSSTVNQKIVFDAIYHLFRLFNMRLFGMLQI